jgi:hypothetical protein
MGIVHLLGGLDAQVGQQFPDVKTSDDLRALAQNDPARFEVLRQKMAQAAAHQEAGRVNQARQQQQAQVYAHQFQDFARHQDSEVGKLVPELAANFPDKETTKRLQNASVELLREKGFSQNEIAGAWHNGTPLLLRDARVQATLADAAKFRLMVGLRKEIESKKNRTPSPVQRPGRASNVFADHSADEVFERLQKSHSVDDAVRVLEARRVRR